MTPKKPTVPPIAPVRALRLTSRERTVIRCIDESSGTLGEEVLEHAHMDETDLLDILHCLINTGIMEAFMPNEELPMMTEVRPDQFRSCRFEFNPAFTAQIRVAMRRG